MDLGIIDANQREVLANETLAAVAFGCRCFVYFSCESDGPFVVDRIFMPAICCTAHGRWLKGEP